MTFNINWTLARVDYSCIIICISSASLSWNYFPVYIHPWKLSTWFHCETFKAETIFVLDLKFDTFMTYISGEYLFLFFFEIDTCCMCLHCMGQVAKSVISLGHFTIANKIMAVVHLFWHFLALYVSFHQLSPVRLTDCYSYTVRVLFTCSWILYFRASSN